MGKVLPKKNKGKGGNKGVGVDFKKVRRSATPLHFEETRAAAAPTQPPPARQGLPGDCSDLIQQLLMPLIPSWLEQVKRKVGKRLPKAQNETRTDFKAKAISLPSQSVAADKGAAPVSERNLTLPVRGLWGQGLTRLHCHCMCQLISGCLLARPPASATSRCR